MYTTGDLDKSTHTHKKLMYVESQHMSEDEKHKTEKISDYK